MPRSRKAYKARVKILKRASAIYNAKRAEAKRLGIPVKEVELSAEFVENLLAEKLGEDSVQIVEPEILQSKSKV